MRNKILILFVFSLLCSCRNYESEKYIAKENEAINDIIPLLIKNDEIVKGNDFDTNNFREGLHKFIKNWYQFVN